MVNEKLSKFFYISFHFFLLSLFSFSLAKAQPVTGVWKGKIDRKNVEVKIVKKGDSLTGTSYYYESTTSYRRYSIKGYFEERDNSVIWWDDELIEEKTGRKNIFATKNTTPYLAIADFNCPGGTKMFLNGVSAFKEKAELERGPIDLQKFSTPIFKDEWDYVIENYTVGANDPILIDSIGQIAFTKTKPIIPNVVETTKPIPVAKNVAAISKKQTDIPIQKKETTATPLPPKIIVPVAVTAPLTNLQKFTTRSKEVMQEIPISGDTIELRFYDNAEIDGDSIAVFLNNQLTEEHIRLTEKAYIIKLPVASLNEINELVMVAENLGSIPPNTSLMIAMVNGKRYEVRIVSTEQSSGVIKFVR